MPDWQRALVTGASSGIGEAFARRLGADGTNLVLVARGADALGRVAGEIGGSRDVTVEVLTADLGTQQGRVAVAERLRDDAAPIDLLVNNAGVGTSGAFGEIDLQRELALVALNVTAVVHLTHAAVAAMRPRGRGGIINVSSLTGFQPYPFGANYGASKAYVTSFSKALHTELADHGVRVLALCPGFTRTNFQSSAGIARTPIPDRLWLQPQEVVDEGLAALAAGRAVRVPGPAFKAYVGLTRIVPDVLLRRALASVGRRRH